MKFTQRKKKLKKKIEALLYEHPSPNTKVAKKMSCKYLCGRQRASSALQRNFRGIAFVLPQLHGRTEVHLWCSTGSQGGCCWNLWQPPIKPHQHRRWAKGFVVGQGSVGWAASDGADQSCQEEKEGRKSNTPTWPQGRISAFYRNWKPVESSVMAVKAQQ